MVVIGFGRKELKRLLKAACVGDRIGDLVGVASLVFDFGRTERECERSWVFMTSLLSISLKFIAFSYSSKSPVTLKAVRTPF